MTVSNTAGLPSLPAEPRPLPPGRGQGAGTLEQIMEMLRDSVPTGTPFGASPIEQHAMQQFGASQDPFAPEAEPANLAFDGEAFLAENAGALEGQGDAFDQTSVQGERFQTPLGAGQFAARTSSEFGRQGGAFEQSSVQGEQFESPLLSGQALNRTYGGGSEVQDATGLTRTLNRGFLNEQSIEGPLLSGYAVRGGDLSSQTRITPDSRTTTFSGQTFQGQYLEPTPQGAFRQPPAQVAVPPSVTETAAPPPQLTASGNTISDGRYKITANQFGPESLGITDTQTHTTLMGFGDTHYEDGDGDTGDIQRSSAHLHLANGTELLINNTPVNAQGVSELADVQVTAGGKTARLSGFGGTATASQDAPPLAANGPVVELGTRDDLNHIAVQTPNGPVKALAPNLGGTQLDQFAPAQAPRA